MEDLKSRAEEIRDEKKIAANTAARIGRFLLDLLSRAQETFQEKLGKDHQVEIETIDYGSAPKGSLLFDGDTLTLKLQIPRGKDGDDAPVPTVDTEGFWEVGGEQVGPAFVPVYEIVAEPESPLADDAGRVLDNTPISISCYKKSAFGPRVLLTDGSFSVQADYVKVAENKEQVVYQLKKALANPLQFLNQQGGNTLIRFKLVDAEGNAYASKEITYIRQGKPGSDGDDGDPGGVFRPIWKPNGILGFEYEPLAGDITLEDTQVIPSISEGGNWVIGGEDTGRLADAAGALTTAQQAARSAEEAGQVASEATRIAKDATQKAQTAASTASTAKTTAESAKTLAQTAQTSAETATQKAEAAKILNAPAVKNYQTGRCYLPEVADEEYIIAYVTGSGDFCIAHALTQANKICYVLIKNDNAAGGDPIVVTMPTGTGYYSPGMSFSLSPQQAREISYIKSGANGITYISWGQTLNLYN